VLGREVVARELDCPDVDRDRAVAGAAAEGPQNIGDGGGDFDSREVADRVVEFSEKESHTSGRLGRRLDRIGDERQCGTVECVADELGCEVERPVAEALVSSRCSVMGLVRVEDHELPRQGDAPRAAVAKRLHAGPGNANRVGVVAVRLERARGEIHLRALETERACPEANRVAPLVARSFKTIGIDAA